MAKSDIVIQMKNPRPFRPVDPMAWSIKVPNLKSKTVELASGELFQNLARTVLFQSGKPKKIPDLRFQVAVLQNGKEIKVHSFSAVLKQNKKKETTYSIKRINNPENSGEKVLKFNSKKKGGAHLLSNPALLPPGFLQQILMYDVFEFDQAYIDYWNLNVWAPLWTYPNPSLPYFSPYLNYLNPLTTNTLNTGQGSSLNPS